MGHPHSFRRSQKFVNRSNVRMRRRKVAARTRRSRPIRGATEKDTTSSGAATLHAQVLETLAARLRSGMRPRVTDGGGDKAGNQNDKRGHRTQNGWTKEKDCTGW